MPRFLTGMLDAPGRMGGRPLFGRAVYEWMGGRARAMFSVVDLDRDFRSSRLRFRPATSGFISIVFSAI